MRGCCDDSPVSSSRIEFDLPDTTFCCMAKMAYKISMIAEMRISGRARPAWGELIPQDHLWWAKQAKHVIKNDAVVADALFSDIIRTMTTAA